MASCVDTVLLPDDKTVDEDFWQSKADVSMMVNGAYSKMAAADVVSKLIVWGGFRSDELVLVNSINDGTRNSLLEIEEVNIETTNAFAEWAPIYSVINNCNIVLEKSEKVMSIDPNYTSGDYETDRSQMLALRALCYFYLVRTFRDVPYTTAAYMNSSQDMTIRQIAPDSLLMKCIADLEEAEKNALSAAASGWQRVGWINKEAIHSLLADIYLWRASVKHSAEDYQKCIAYCDMVIESKKANHVQGPMEIVAKEYPLEDGNMAYQSIFGIQNSEESIFELQNATGAINTYYYKYKDDKSTYGYLRASSIFGSYAASSLGTSPNTYLSMYDYRYWQNTYDVGSGASAFDVRKMTDANGTTSLPTAGIKRSSSKLENQNFIIYRLSDVMLMKAEAMVANEMLFDKVYRQTVQQIKETYMAEGLTEATAENKAKKEAIYQLFADDLQRIKAEYIAQGLTEAAAETKAKADVESRKDIKLRNAFNIVQYVNKRSMDNGGISDSLKWNTYADVQRMEELILAERLREHCFEGKRWFDLLRFNYRHVEGIDYSTILAEQGTEASTFVKNHGAMLDIMARKDTEGADARKAKMRTEPYLYMPIPRSDTEICDWLMQNPAYSDNDSYTKND